MTTPEPTTDLSLYADWLKREVAVPGTFKSLFPTTTDDQLTAALVDGLYRAKLDGWLPTVNADPDTFLTDQVVPMEAVAIIVIYTAIKFVQNQITNMTTRQTYKAPGGLESTTERAPSVLTERLKQLNQEKKELLETVQGGRRPRTTILMSDGYAIRASSLYALRTEGHGLLSLRA